MPKQDKTEPLQVPHMCWCPSQMLSPMSAGTKTHKSNMQAETKRYYSQTQTNRKLNGQQQQQQQPFNGRLSGTTRVGRYQKKHSPAHTHPGQRISFITFLHLQWSMASSLFSLRA